VRDGSSSSDVKVIVRGLLAASTAPMQCQVEADEDRCLRPAIITTLMP
jgi:hypothetical protein